jgi:hypothetical protein
MTDVFQFSHVMREKLIALVRGLSIDQLNKIPEGLNNNIAWHIGHIVVSTEILCYQRSGVQPDKVIYLADKYKNGTRPESFIEQAEVDDLLSRLITSLQEIEADYAKGFFTKMTPYTTHTFGFEIPNIEGVFECCTHHDLLHCGNMNIIKKLV